MDPTVLIEGVGGGAAAVGVVRNRRRTPRVRRDPIDIQLVNELVESEAPLGADEVLAALEAEVSRTATRRAVPERVPERVAEPAEEPVPAPEPRATEPTSLPTPTFVPRAARLTAVPTAPPPETARTDGPACGISPDQVHEWMAAVQEDLRKVRARVQYLQAEQSRLEEQQRLMAQLISSSTPV